MTEVETAWLAGLCDGEAYFGPRCVELELTDADLVDRVARLIEVEKVTTRVRDGNKRTYRVRIYGQPALDVMRAVVDTRLMSDRRKATIYRALWMNAERVH